LSLDTEAWPTARYRMPAEWAPHEATWLSWPHNPETWPDCFDLVEPAMVEVVRMLAETERVHINVLDDAHASHLEDLLDGVAPPERVSLHRCPTNDAWIRDHGAIFVADPDTGERLALDFEYNAWGGKYPPFDRDRRVATYMAEALGVPRFAPGLVLEGGSIEVNGAGALLTTEQCLLNPNRNPELSREDIEAALRAGFGVRDIVWLGAGIEGDDTDGHIDDITRFIREDVVLTMVERRADDANYHVLEQNRERLADLHTANASHVEVLTMEMPEPLVPRGGWRLDRLPGSYANFLILNGAVLVPIFNQTKRDASALGFLRECFPGREVIGVEASDLVFEGGAIHCISQQQPG
jgi:agmatine deiminase